MGKSKGRNHCRIHKVGANEVGIPENCRAIVDFIALLPEKEVLEWSFQDSEEVEQPISTESSNTPGIKAKCVSNGRLAGMYLSGEYCLEDGIAYYNGKKIGENQEDSIKIQSYAAKKLQNYFK